MTSHFTSERFGAEHVTENFVGACSAFPYKGYASRGPTTDVADWMASPDSLFDFEADLHEVTQDFDHMCAEKVFGHKKVAEFYDSSNNGPSYTDQELPLTRSVELAMAVPGCDTAVEQHYLDTQVGNGGDCSALRGTGPQALAQNETSVALMVTLMEPLLTTADAAHGTARFYQAAPMAGFVSEDPAVVQQEAAETVLRPVPMLTQTTDLSTDEASDTPFVVAGEDTIHLHQHHGGGFDVHALFEAYNEARAQRCRRRTLSEAFALLFPAQAAANLIPVPKNSTHTELIAGLAFSLQIKISNAGRRGRGTSKPRRLFRKLHDALHQAGWLRDNDADYYYYSRPAGQV